ncbi:tryptophan--tRNA ligase [Niveibacterium sp. SC-1]|uniref:tryptophan--tRNA ligase n=1 Tax=Niveibacterium sp. SC-1 TaxID=3135646 RepID=UPI00311F5139
MLAERVLSGMRPIGRLHLGHYHGVLKDWTALQAEFPCFFLVADWHALTAGYEDTKRIGENVWEMVIDWLAAGVDPNQSTLFIQSRVPEHAELQLLLSMMTPRAWLERVPSYKEQVERPEHEDLDTFGFLGYPLLQSADILIYRSTRIPVGEDQLPHIELARELARRFNHLYGREPGYEERARSAVKKLGAKRGRHYDELRTRYQQEGDAEALAQARAVIDESQSLSLGDRERLYGYIEGGGKRILVEPSARLTPAARLPGLDGRKMSRSRGNTINLREDADTVARKLRTMVTDPARVRRDDPGDPGNCPVWPLHQIYSDAATQSWAQEGCRSAGIGCLECKQPLIDAVVAEQQMLSERAQPYVEDPSLVRNIVAEGCERARKLAQETLREVREAMGLDYS